MIQQPFLILLLLLLLIGGGGCRSQMTLLPALEEIRSQSDPFDLETVDTPITPDIPYLLTTANFADDEGYLTVTRSGGGLMQIRRPRYAVEQTHWRFTPAGNHAFYLQRADQPGDWVYNHKLIAVEITDDEDRFWQLTLLANGTYRLTNQALGAGQSLTAVSDGMPYPGWGEVTFAETVEADSQQWILEEMPTPLAPEIDDEPPARGAAADVDDDEPPARGTVASADTIFFFEDFGTWQRGEQPYGELRQSLEQNVTGSSAHLHYDFSLATEADDFVVFLRNAHVDGSPDLLKAQVYGDGSSHFLIVWILDAAGETWSIALGQVQGMGWQELHGALDPNAGWPTGHISGPENGQIDYPIQLAGLVLDRVDVNAPVTGDIFLDDLTFTIGAAPVAVAAEEIPASATATPTNGEVTNIEASADGPVAATPAEAVATDPPAAEQESPATPATDTSTSDPVVSGYSYELIPIEGGRDSRPAAEHADLNLDLRELRSIDEALNFIETDGDTDEYAPNFLGVLAPNFKATYTAYDWDWGCNCKSGPIEYPWGRVAAVEFATTPGDAIYILRRQFDIYQGKFYAVLLYATEESLTYVYTREGNIANGYAIHYKGLATDPNLLKLYRESSGDALPGLTLDTPVGVARDSLIVGIRDRGAFMDPRNHENWWLDRGLPRPPGR